MASCVSFKYLGRWFLGRKVSQLNASQPKIIGSKPQNRGSQISVKWHAFTHWQNYKNCMHPTSVNAKNISLVQPSWCTIHNADKPYYSQKSLWTNFQMHYFYHTPSCFCAQLCILCSWVDRHQTEVKPNEVRMNFMFLPQVIYMYMYI